jgi:ribosomal protein L11 methyltransferase
MENVRLNGVTGGEVILGDATAIRRNAFDVVLANINRNILLADMKAYSDGMKDNASILFSGFYEEDCLAIREAAEKNGLRYAGTRTRNNWAVMLFTK